MPAGGMDEARILVIDDESSNLLLLERILECSGFRHVRATSDPRAAEGHFVDFQPDLVLLDLHMPFLDGFEVMARLRPLIPDESFLPIVVLTADITKAARQRALSEGAQDFITKPIDASETVLRIRNLLRTRFLHLQLQSQNEALEARVRDRTGALESAHLETVERLARAAECRDYDTGRHAQRVGDLSAMLAESLGLPAAEVQLIRRAAPLHDIGKIAVSDTILLKPAALTSDEFHEIKRHTVIGANLLSGSQSPLLRLAEEIALFHHERWDGNGYARVAGEATPLPARIVAVADVFDALSHHRPYRRAWPADQVVAEIMRQRGRHFDPEVADAFLRVHADIPADFAEVEEERRSVPA